MEHYNEREGWIMDTNNDEELPPTRREGRGAHWDKDEQSEEAHNG